jgi:hypothetical protein
MYRLEVGVRREQALQARGDEIRGADHEAKVSRALD